MIIALMGNDGSGKTTLARALAEKLGRAGLAVEYRQGGDHFLLTWLQKLFPGKRLRGHSKGFCTKTAGSLYSSASGPIWYTWTAWHFTLN